MRGFLVGMEVTGDEGIGQEKFFAMDRDEGAFETNVAGFDALHFFTGQDQAGLVVVSEGVVETGAFVGGESGHSACSMPYRTGRIKFREKKNGSGAVASELGVGKRLHKESFGGEVPPRDHFFVLFQKNMKMHTRITTPIAGITRCFQNMKASPFRSQVSFQAGRVRNGLFFRSEAVEKSE